MLNSLRTFKLRLSKIWLIAMLMVITQRAFADWLDDYASYVQKEASKYNVPGYAFVFYEQGKAPRVYVYGSTRKRGGEKVTENTVFRLASVSKTFTALLSAKLVEKNQLSWETPITTLLPDIPFKGKGCMRCNCNISLANLVALCPTLTTTLLKLTTRWSACLNPWALEPLCAPGECYTYQNALFGAWNTTSATIIPLTHDSFRPTCLHH